MIKKTLLILLILCFPMSGIVLAGSASSGVGYFTSETAAIIADVVLFPFRLIRDIFDPPPRPMMVPYPYLPPAVIAAPPPMAPAAVPPAIVPSAPLQPPPVNDSVEINIPNGNGSYTFVTLKKTDKGFLGPQGEFYTDQPTMEQLKERYSKSNFAEKK